MRGSGLGWFTPLLALLAGRGGCVERGQAALLLWVKPSTVRRMAWGLARRGLARLEGQRLCLTRRGLSEAARISVVARKRNHYVAVADGRVVLVSYHNRGATVYEVPLGLLCRIVEALSSGALSHREVAEKLGVPSKTASYGVKAARILGCPGAGCVLECPGRAE